MKWKEKRTLLSEDAILVLIKRFNEQDEYQKTVQELVHLGSPAVPSLIYALTDREEALTVRLGAAQALGQIRDERAIVPLISVCNLTDEEGDSLDYLIVPVLAEFGVRALPSLVATLADRKRDVLIRAAVAWTLGKLREQEVLELLVERLQDDNEASRVRSHAAYGLGELGDKRAVPPLMEVLSQEADEDLRPSTTTALGWLRDARAVELLIKVLQTDAESNVQGCAAKALSLIGDARAISPLVEAVALLRGGYRAAEALAPFGTPALQALLHTLQNKNYQTHKRGNLVYVLRYFKQEEAFTRLLAVLNDEHEESVVRVRAALALGLQGNPHANAPLLALLMKHKDTPLRIACAYALGGRRDRSVLPALQEILQNESATTPLDAELKKAAETATKMINR